MKILSTCIEGTRAVQARPTHTRVSSLQADLTPCSRDDVGNIIGSFRRSHIATFRSRLGTTNAFRHASRKNPFSKEHVRVHQDLIVCSGMVDVEDPIDIRIIESSGNVAGTDPTCSHT